MKTFTIDYSETYTGTFDVTLPDDATEQDAIDELLQNPETYDLPSGVELTDSSANNATRPSCAAPGPQGQVRNAAEESSMDTSSTTMPYVQQSFE